MMTILKNEIKVFTHQEWIAINPILLDGEIACEKDTKRFKMGDGVTTYKDLDYIVDPCVSLMYTDLMSENVIRTIISIFSFILVAIIWGLLSIIDWVNGLSFIWQFIGCGIIYYTIFIIISLKVKKHG